MLEDYESLYDISKKEFKALKKRLSKSPQAKDKKSHKKTVYPTAKDTYRGRVLSCVGDKILVDCSGTQYHCSIRGSLKKGRPKERTLIAVGDFVQVKPQKEKEGQILTIEERISTLARSDPIQKKKHIIAVNIDQVFITASVVSPSFKPFLIDRYLIAAKKGNMQPIILVNKMDLLKNKEDAAYEEFLPIYASLDIPILKVCCITKDGISTLKKLMKNKASVFSGQSGVGKSSLINLTTGLNLPVGEVQEKSGKGKHKTTRAQLVSLKQGGFCIDTPGIKQFGLWDLQRDDILDHFHEIKKVGQECKYHDCHHFMEPNCAVKEAVDEGLIFPLRYQSYITLLEELS